MNTSVYKCTVMIVIYLMLCNFYLQIIEKFTLRPSPCKNIVVSEGNSTRTLSVYDIQQHLHTTKQLDVMATYSQHHLYGTSHLPTVYAHRYVTGN